MVARACIRYDVGNENNPSNPFGRSSLRIEVDGRARHELFTLGPCFAWTGVVIASALDRFWSALEQAAFPAFPMVPVPAGSTIRSLRIGEGDDAPSIFLPFHASVAGYDVAFSILDALLHQMSEGRVKDGASSSPIVEHVAQAEPPRRDPPAPAVANPGLDPGSSFLLAYQSARRDAHAAKLAHLATLTDPALAHARMFGAHALKIEGMSLGEAGPELGIGIGDLPEITMPASQHAWNAGKTAREILIAAELAAHVAYFRASAPANTTLAAQAETHARTVGEGAATLANELGSTRCHLAVRYKDRAAQMVSLTGDAHAEHLSLAQDLGTFFGAMKHHIDDAARRLFDVIDARNLRLSKVAGWDAIEPKIFTPERPQLQPVLERAFGFLRNDATRATAEWTEPPARSPDPIGRMKRHAKLVEDVRARMMAPEDAYERLAPKSWLGDERRWFVNEKVPPGTQLEGPILSVAWTSWAVGREPSSHDVLTTLCADPKNAELAENYALEACRHMAVWGWRTPRRVIWMAEHRPRFFLYEDARPFRAETDEMLRKVFATEQQPETRAQADDVFDEAKLLAKRDLMRARHWPASIGRNPFEPIVEVWRLGYAVAAVLDIGVVLLAHAPKVEELVNPLV